MLVKNIFKLFVLSFIILTAFLITFSGFRHFHPFTEISSFISSKKAYFSFYLPAVYGHVLTGGFLMFIGLLGFSEYIRNKYLRAHRVLGKIYVVLVLCVSAPCALIMAILADGGIIVKSCFILLSLLWWFFTLQAFNYIKKGNIVKHRDFMLRSYALLLSAICLRLYSFFWVLSGGFKSPEVYVYLAWASWVPNFIIVEIYLIIRKIKMPPKII